MRAAPAANGTGPTTKIDIAILNTGKEQVHGMFEKNIHTFNPGWDSNAQKLGVFTDVRDLQRKLKSQGVALVNEADENTTTSTCCSRRCTNPPP